MLQKCGCYPTSSKEINAPPWSFKVSIPILMLVLPCFVMFFPSRLLWLWCGLFGNHSKAPGQYSHGVILLRA